MCLAFACNNEPNREQAKPHSQVYVNLRSDKDTGHAVVLSHPQLCTKNGLSATCLDGTEVPCSPGVASAVREHDFGAACEQHETGEQDKPRGLTAQNTVGCPNHSEAADTTDDPEPGQHTGQAQTCAASDGCNTVQVQWIQ